MLLSQSLPSGKNVSKHGRDMTLIPLKQLMLTNLDVEYTGLLNYPIALCWVVANRANYQKKGVS